MNHKPVGVLATLQPSPLPCPHGGLCDYDESLEVCASCLMDMRPQFQMVAPSYRVAALTCNRFLALCSESGVDTSGYVFKVAALHE